MITEEKNITGFPSIDKPWLKHYSKDAQNLKVPEKTIYQNLYDNNIEYLKDTAINYFGIKITYKKLFEEIDKTAKSFKKLGVKKGDIVTICLPNIPEAAYILYALNKIGAIANFVHPLSKEKDFNHYLDEAESNLLIIYDDVYKEADKVSSDKLNRIIHVSPTNSIPAPIMMTKNTVENIQTLINGKKREIKKNKIPNNNRNLKWNSFKALGKNYRGPIDVAYEKDRPAIMVHTGGTTGEPKGVLLSDDNYNSEVAQIAAKAKFNRGDVMLGITPPFISYVSCNALHMPLVLGTPLVMIPDFIPGDLDKYINKYNPQIIQGNPGYCKALTTNKNKDKMDLSNFTYLVSGGDKLYPDVQVLIDNFLEAHRANIRVTQGLGCTECTSCVAFTFEDINKVGSVGIPLVLTDIMVVDPDTNEEVQYNEEGELCISGPTVMLGYYKNETETKKAIRKHSNGKTYYHTGDIVKVDTDGLIYHTDRIRRIILTQDLGNVVAKVFPNKVETVVLKDERVKECVVIGVEDPIRLNLTKAYIKLVDGYKLDKHMKKELEQLCKDNLPDYALPFNYEEVSNFPLTSIGKIDYRTLEKMNENNFSQEMEKQKVKTKTINHL